MMKKLTRDGVALAYNEDGTGDPPMVLVHCWVCDHTFFAPQFDHFSGTLVNAMIERFLIIMASQISTT